MRRFGNPPAGRRRLRRGRTAALVLAMTTGAAPVIAVTGTAHADGPQSFGMAMVSDTGSLMIGGQEPGQKLKDPTSINGTYDEATGQLSNVSFTSPAVTFEQRVTQPIPLTLTITETLIQRDPGSGTGTLDEDGNLTLDLDFALRVQIDSSLAKGDCYSQPVQVQLTSTSPYDATTGRVALKAEGFEVKNFEVTDKCAKLIVDNSGAQFAGTRNRIQLTLQGSLGTPLEATTTTLTATPGSPVMQGDETTLTATVSPAAAGSVTFLSGDDLIASAPLDAGTASVTTKLGAGDHQLRVEYGGDATHAGSASAPLTYSVRPYARISGDLPGTVRAGAAPKEFTLTARNPGDGRDEPDLQVGFGIAQDPVQSFEGYPGYGNNIESDDIVLEAQDAEGAWQRIPLTGAVVDQTSLLTGSLGDDFALAPGTSRAVPMRISIAAGAPAKTLTTTATLRQAGGATLDTVSSQTIVPLAERIPLGEWYGPRISFDTVPYTWARGYLMPWQARASAPYDPTGPVVYPTPDGRAEILVDGQPAVVAGPDVTSSVQPLNNIGYVGSATLRLDTLDLAPGTHTFQVRYLGGTNYLPSLSPAVEFVVLPAFGKVYDCSYLQLGSTVQQRVIIAANGDAPAYAPNGSEVAVENVDVTVGADQRTRISAVTSLTGDLRDGGSVSVSGGTLEASNAEHRDYRMKMKGGSGTATIEGAAGDRVDLLLDRVRFNTPGSFGERSYDCVPTGAATSVDDVAVVGTTLEVSPSGSSALGEEVTLTARVQGLGSVSTGKVAFTDGDRSLGVVPLSAGVAVIKTKSLALGKHTLTAAWSGTLGVPEAPSAPVEHRVQGGTTTTLASSADPSAYGAKVAWTATVRTDAGTPAEGSVQFAVDGAPVGEPVALSAGKATSSVVGDLAVGEHEVTATYSGADSATTSSASLAQTVTQATTTLKATPALAQLKGLQLYLTDLNAMLTAPGGPVAGETVTFKAGARVICTAVTNAQGVASCSGTASVLQIVLGLGYTAQYAGSASYLPSTGKASLIG